MAKFILYEGASDDPMRQTMRLVDGEDIEEAWERYKARAICIQSYVEEPSRQEPIDEKKLRRGMLVWSA